MRSTFNLDDDVLQAVRSLAAARRISTGRVISELVRKALQAPSVKRTKGFPVFDVPPDAPPITPEMVREALDED